MAEIVTSVSFLRAVNSAFMEAENWSSFLSISLLSNLSGLSPSSNCFCLTFNNIFGLRELSYIPV